MAAVLVAIRDLGTRAALAQRVVLAGGFAGTPGAAQRVTAEVAAAAASVATDTAMGSGYHAAAVGAAVKAAVAAASAATATLAAAAAAGSAKRDVPSTGACDGAGFDAWRGGSLLAYDPSTLYVTSAFQDRWGYTPWACW